MKKKKIAIYTRVSTEDQTTLNQILILVDYCEKNNYDYEVFSEIESSGKVRVIKQNLMNRLRKREFDGVVVYRLDRFGRSTTELILDIEELTNKGILFISYSENLDFSTPTGKLQFTILSAFACFEKSLLSERTKDGLARAKAQGKKLGRPKGSKDSKLRKKSGYHLRYSTKKDSK